jgi:hypothetical protein
MLATDRSCKHHFQVVSNGHGCHGCQTFSYAVQQLYGVLLRCEGDFLDPWLAAIGATERLVHVQGNILTSHLWH